MTTDEKKVGKRWEKGEKKMKVKKSEKRRRKKGETKWKMFEEKFFWKKIKGLKNVKKDQENGFTERVLKGCIKSFFFQKGFEKKGSEKKGSKKKVWKKSFFWGKT